MRARVSISLIGLLTLTLVSCTGGRSHPPAPPNLRRPAASSRARFQAVQVRAVDALDRPQASQQAAQVAAGVVALLNDYYNISFLDPSRWHGGSHPDLAGLFSPEAQAAAARDLKALALADLAPKLKRVEATRQEASRVSVLIEQNLDAPVAIVSAAFEGTGQPVGSGEGPVNIEHTATFLLTKEASAFKISAYDVTLKVDTA